MIGKADAWDNAGGGETWYFEKPGEYSVRLSREGFATAWVKIVVDPSAPEKIAEVDTELRRTSKKTRRLKWPFGKKRSDGGEH